MRDRTSCRKCKKTSSLSKSGLTRAKAIGNSTRSREMTQLPDNSTSKTKKFKPTETNLTKNLMKLQEK